MKPAELFGVIVRTIGLLSALGGLFLVFLATVHVAFNGPGFFEGYIYGVPGLFVGVYLLSGAKLLINSVYPTGPDQQRAKSGSSL